jgi:hypothetical protein
VSVFSPTVERHSLGGWPDGITPGFIELGAAPTSGAGFQCPPGSVARVGSTYYLKVGSSATAWILISSLALSPAYSSFRRNDLHQCAGVQLGAGPADIADHAESASTGAATASFETYIIAYPEIMPVDGTITSIGFYNEGIAGGSGYRAWVAACTTRLLSGNDEPDLVLATHEYVAAGFDGELFRSVATAIPVTRNQKVWFVTQTKNSNAVRGYRLSSAFRPCLGETTTSPLTATSSKGVIGLRSTAAAAYAVPAVSSALASLPTLLPVGNDTIGSGSANTVNRPTIYFQVTPT